MREGETRISAIAAFSWSAHPTFAMPGPEIGRRRFRRGTVAAALTDEPPSASVEVVHVRNFDHTSRHSAVLTLEDPESGDVVVDRHALAPGQAATTTARLEPGEYVLHITVDGVDRKRRTCSLGPAPADTAVVELGNGAVSVTMGARSSLAVD